MSRQTKRRIAISIILCAGFRTMYILGDCVRIVRIHIFINEVRNDTCQRQPEDVASHLVVRSQQSSIASSGSRRTSSAGVLCNMCNSHMRFEEKSPYFRLFIISPCCPSRFCIHHTTEISESIRKLCSKQK